MKPMIRGVILAGTILSLLFGLVPSVFPADTLESISNELVCQCGCGLVLNNCSHSDCGSAIPMRKIIQEKLTAGETREGIISYFVSDFGEVVLAAPIKKGFNLTIWLLPFGAIIVGGGFIVFMIRYWVRQRRQALSPEEVVRLQTYTPEKYREIFDSELKDFE